MIAFFFLLFAQYRYRKNPAQKNEFLASISISLSKIEIFFYLYSGFKEKTAQRRGSDSDFTLVIVSFRS